MGLKCFEDFAVSGSVAEHIGEALCCLSLAVYFTGNTYHVQIGTLNRYTITDCRPSNVIINQSPVIPFYAHRTTADLILSKS